MRAAFVVYHSPSGGARHAASAYPSEIGASLRETKRAAAIEADREVRPPADRSGKNAPVRCSRVSSIFKRKLWLTPGNGSGRVASVKGPICIFPLRSRLIFLQPPRDAHFAMANGGVCRAERWTTQTQFRAMRNSRLFSDESLASRWNGSDGVRVRTLHTGGSRSGPRALRKRSYRGTRARPFPFEVDVAQTAVC